MYLKQNYNFTILQLCLLFLIPYVARRTDAAPKSAALILREILKKNPNTFDPSQIQYIRSLLETKSLRKCTHIFLFLARASHIFDADLKNSNIYFLVMGMFKDSWGHSAMEVLQHHANDFSKATVSILPSFFLFLFFLIL